MVIKSLESVDLLSNPFLRNGRFFKHALKIGNRGCNQNELTKHATSRKGLLHAEVVRVDLQI